MTMIDLNTLGSITMTSRTPAAVAEVETLSQRPCGWPKGTYRVVDAEGLEKSTSEGWQLVRLLETTETDRDKDGTVETYSLHRFLLRLDEEGTIRAHAKKTTALAEKLVKAEENLNLALRRKVSNW